LVRIRHKLKKYFYGQACKTISGSEPTRSEFGRN
jgi:hypothetical protein